MANILTIPLCLVSTFVLIGCASKTTKETLTSSTISQPNTATSETKSISSNIKILGMLPHGLTLETLSGEYVTEFITVIEQESWTEIVLSPSEYQWVEGEIKGNETTPLPSKGTWSETVTDKFIIQEETTELSTRPALYVKNGAEIESAEVIERVIPAITKEFKRRIWKTAGPAYERVTPYEYKDGKTRVPIKTFPPKEKTHPAITRQLAKRKQISPSTYIVKNETGQITHKFNTRDEVEAFLDKSN